ncbi:MAG: SRPBCC family protein [Bacteroidota bacterium]
MTAQQSIFIKADSAKLFAYLNDVHNRKAFIPALEEVVMLDEGPIRLGSRYVEVANIAGRKLETTYQVIEFEKNKHVVVKTLKSIFPIRVDMDLMEQQGGTQLNIKLDFTLKGVFRLGSSVVKGVVNQQAKGILEQIKQNIENQ